MMFVNSTGNINRICAYIPPESPVQKKSLDERISFIFLLIKALFGSQKAQFELGSVYKLERKDNDKAIRWFERVVKRGGKLAGTASFELGGIYKDGQKKEDIDKAIRCFRKVKKCFESAEKESEEGYLYRSALLDLAFIYRERGETKKANNCYNRAIRRGPIRMEKAPDVGVIVIYGPLFSRRFFHEDR